MTSFSWLPDAWCRKVKGKLAFESLRVPSLLSKYSLEKEFFIMIIIRSLFA